MKIAANISIGLAVVVLFVLYGMQKKNEPVIVYMNVQGVYDEFKMKKELEAKLSNVVQARKLVLDSLELQLKILSGNIENTPKRDVAKENMFMGMREEYLQKKKQFDEDGQVMTQQYTEQIMKQMNEYVQEYGKLKGYTYILGAEGTGSVMYAEDRLDITREITSYINEKYKGGIVK